jgi:hypothetical protein
VEQPDWSRLASRLFPWSVSKATDGPSNLSVEQY